MTSLNDIIETFASVDDEMRMALLLDYSRKLPPLPARYESQRERGQARVPECMTPVYLWVEKTPRNTLDIHIHVAQESPTVAGFMGLLRESLQDQPLELAQAVPSDLLHALKLDNLLRMNRAVGLSALIGRIKKQAAILASHDLHAKMNPSPSTPGDRP
jgi:cysteine desulfuration protein SufE